MAESLVQVTEGVGKKLHTNSRSISGNTVEDEYTLPGEIPHASYTALYPAVTCASATDLAQLMAGASLNVRVRRIRARQFDAAGAAASKSLVITRKTSAGTGGTAVTPRPLDSADAAAGATAMIVPTVLGGAGVDLWSEPFPFSATQPVAGTLWEWTPAQGEKSILIPAGTANGIVLRLGTAVATATLSIIIDFIETSFV